MVKRLAHTIRALLAGARGKRGESLTEVLVAVTIGGLALIILAMAISVSSHMAMNSRTVMEKYYDANNAAVAGSADSLGTGTVALKQADGSSVPLVSSSQTVGVTYYGNSEGGASAIVLYDADSSTSGGGA